MTYLQRKKLAFMAIVNQVKGFVRTISGVPPLTLPDCVNNDSVISYTIRGNSVQDGTPTYDEPVEIVSVGELTENLFDVNNAQKLDGYIGVDKNIVASEVTDTFYISCKPNTKYTFSRKFIKKKDSVFRIGYGASIPSNNTDMLTAIATNVSGLTVSITTDASAKYLFVCEGSVAVDNTENTSEFQIQEGYRYKIPVTCSGINLLSPDTPCEHVYTTLEGIKVGVLFLKVEPKTRYSYNDSVADGSMGYEYYDENMIFLGVSGGRTSAVDTNITFTTSPETGYVKLFVDVDRLNNGTLYFNKGSEYIKERYVEPVTSYIYLSSPLRKLGNYSDYIDFENGQIVRNVGERMVLDTGYSLINYTNISYLSVDKSWNAIEKGNQVHTYPKRAESFKHGVYDSTAGGGFNNTRYNGSIVIAGVNNYFIGFDAGTTLETMVDKLKSSRLFYVLAEPTIGSIDLPKIPSFKGTTVYTIGTEVQPSEMDVTYYSTAKE